MTMLSDKQKAGLKRLLPTEPTAPPNDGERRFATPTQTACLDELQERCTARDDLYVQYEAADRAATAARNKAGNLYDRVQFQEGLASRARAAFGVLRGKVEEPALDDPNHPMNQLGAG